MNETNTAIDPKDSKVDSRRNVHAKPKLARRTCLRCLRMFDSKGPDNRRCPNCQKYVTDFNITE